MFVAKYMTAEGRPTRKVLGKAWVKDSGRETARGATRWRAADGSKPDGYLTPADADDALRGLLEQERRRPDAPRGASGATFGEAVAEWLRYCEQDKQLADTTLTSYRRVVETHLLPEFGEATPLRRITEPRITEYRDRLVAGKLHRSTAHKILVVLSGVMKRAQRRRLIAHNPVADVEPITVRHDSTEFNVLTPEQVEATARAAEADWQPVAAGPRRGTVISDDRARTLTDHRQRDAQTYAAMIRVAAHTGLRLGELRALQWRDIDWGGSVLRVQRNAPTGAPAGAAPRPPKSGQARSVPLTDAATATLDGLSRRGVFTEPGDLVFPSATGAPLDGGHVREAFYRALKAAGLGPLREQEDPVTFHDLRHSFGTLAVQVFPVTDVQAMLGHADLATTMRYVHHVPRHDAARRLTEAFAVKTPGGAPQSAETPASAA